MLKSTELREFQALEKAKDLGEKTREWKPRIPNPHTWFLIYSYVPAYRCMYVKMFSMLQNELHTWCKSIKQLYWRVFFFKK